MGRPSILIALVAMSACGRIGFTADTPTDANGDARSDGAIDGVPRPSFASPFPQELYGVTVLAPDDAWVAGGGGAAFHWNEVAWSAAASGTTMFLPAIWSHSATELWVVGAVGTIQRGP